MGNYCGNEAVKINIPREVKRNPFDLPYEIISDWYFIGDRYPARFNDLPSGLQHDIQSDICETCEQIVNVTRNLFVSDDSKANNWSRTLTFIVDHLMNTYSTNPNKIIITTFVKIVGINPHRLYTNQLNSVKIYIIEFLRTIKHETITLELGDFLPCLNMNPNMLIVSTPESKSSVSESKYTDKRLSITELLDRNRLTVDFNKVSRSLVVAESRESSQKSKVSWIDIDPQTDHDVIKLD